MSDHSSHRIWAIILAAGISSRMGRPKLSLPWGDHTILEETTDQVLEAGYDGVVVVLGDGREEFERLLESRPVKTARNLNFRSGMSSSIKAGVAFIDPDATAFAIVMGNQPGVNARLHQLVLAHYRKSGKGICAPQHDGTTGHPVIFAAKYRSEMFALQGDHGTRGVMELHKDDLSLFEVKSPEIVTSINTMQEYEEHRQHLQLK
jgi:molybdenum cofactor cytidylyltransferase